MADERPFTHLIGGQMHMRGPEGSDDEVIARLATRQHGIVRRRQLLDLLISSRKIDLRVAIGRLRPVHPGVYAVGHDALGFEARALAAVASFRGSAWATHETALRLRGIIERGGTVHVSAHRPRATRERAIVHRAMLRDDEFSIIDGIPTSTAERALLDLSPSYSAEQLRRLFKRSEYEREATVDSLLGILERYPRRPGRRNLAAMVASLGVTLGRSRSELVDRFHTFLVERNLPLPETNVVLPVRGCSYEVDCYWRHAGLVVELDGARSHQSATGFEEDRARDRALVAAGFAVMRVTWAQLHTGAELLEFELRSAIARLTADRSPTP